MRVFAYLLIFSKIFIIFIFLAYKCSFFEDKGTCFADNFIKDKAYIIINDMVYNITIDMANRGTYFTDDFNNLLV